MNMRIGPTAALCGLALVLGAGGGYWFAQQRSPEVADKAEPAAIALDERQVLYWYDPMYPQQRFNKPGKSPFMDMELVPRYADAAADSAAVSIDPRLIQNLGLRLPTDQTIHDGQEQLPHQQQRGQAACQEDFNRHQNPRQKPCR